MFQPFSYIKNPLQSNRLKAIVEGEFPSIPLDLEQYTIYSDIHLINEILSSIRAQKIIMKEYNISPKYVVLSHDAYDQITVYSFNTSHISFPDNILDLEIVFNPKYENIAPVVLSDPKTELTNALFIDRIMSGYRESLNKDGIS